MVIRRKLYLVWLALTLNALAPILAYAHIHVGAHGEIIEHCAADEPGDANTDTQDEHSHHSPSDKGTVPHCPYCAGFAAGLSLAYGGLGPTLPDVVSALPDRPPPAVASGRSSVRIAQQRAPPTFS